MKKILAIALFLTGSVAVFAQSFDTVQIRPLRITDQIYMLKGSGGNIGVLAGPEGLLMIDDQFAPLSEKINKAMQGINPGQLKFLINTHIHGDHTGGNENFKKLGAMIVAHDMVRDRMTKPSVNARTNEQVPPRNADAWPLITFPDRMNFHFNGEDVELYHFTNGHTDGDIIIKFAKANVFHTGDSFVRYGYPFIDPSSGGGFNGFVTNLEKILGLLDDNSKVIPGHGELATKKDVKVVYDMLVDIRNQVSAALKKGKKVEDLPALNLTAKYDEAFGKGFLKGKDFVILVGQTLTQK